MPFFCYNKNDYCGNPKDCDNCDVFLFGKGGKEVPSNADRIRAMSDEELATTIHAISLGYKEEWCDYHCENQGDDGCDNCIKKWLKQPCGADMRGEEDGYKKD